MRRHVDRDIERYFEGGIERASDREALFGHLDRCDRCRTEFDAQAETHRALSGLGRGQLPITELSLIAPALLDAVAPEQRSMFGWRSWAGAAALLAPVALLLLLLQPGSLEPRGELTARGGGALPVLPIEVLCFDAKAQVVAQLKQDGRCPAPGFLKIVYASAAPAGHLTVVALVRGEVRLFAEVAAPKAGTVLSDYARLEPGEQLQVIAVTADGPSGLEVVKSMPATLTVTAGE